MMEQRREDVQDIIALPRNMLVLRVQKLSGTRRSPRLTVAVEILQTFCVLGRFSRSEVIHCFGGHYNIRTLDRAMVLLEACGMLEVLARTQGRLGGGAAYRIRPTQDWHEFSEDCLKARMARARRRP